ncbi:ComGF family competence protein [Aneurinibacillus sp. BA2021]|nr:ComGF family competence protein [Aneurinibacillus sp. BA2021]
MRSRGSLAEQTGRGAGYHIQGIPACPRSPYRNERGVTLLETLLSSVILSLVLLSLLYGFTETQRYFQRVKNERVLEVEARGLFSYMEEEIRRSAKMEQKKGIFYLTHPAGGIITYEKVDERIVRRLNTTGYIIVAQYVRQFQLSIQGEGCMFYVEMEKEGVTWSGRLFLSKREVAETR